MKKLNSIHSSFYVSLLLLLIALVILNLKSCATVDEEIEIPFKDALEAAAIIQKPMAAEIPGSMILGNGDLNGILWVRKGQLRFSITKNDACDGRHETANDPEMCTIDIKKRKWNVPPGAEFPPSWGTPYPTPLICGYVDLSGDESAKSENSAGADTTTIFQSRLDLARAVGAVTNANGVTVTSRVLADRNVALFETEGPIALFPSANRFVPASEENRWSAPADESDTSMPSSLPEPKRGVRDGTQWVLTTVPGDVDWTGMTFAMALASEGKDHVVSVVTSFESEDPVDAAVRLAEKTISEERITQIAAHEKAWEKFWSKSGVSLDDPYLESVWYRNLYFLSCFSKPGVLPVGLFLGCETEVMPWHGVATTDYNFEQCFWPSYVTNHAELAEPYNRFMVDYIPRGKWFAKETYGINGAFYPVNHFNHQINDPAMCKSKNRHMNFIFPYTYVPGANGWQAHNVWLAYLHHPDPDFLKSDAYPIVKEMAIFYSDFLSQCKLTPEGKAIYGPTYSPEHRRFGENNTPCDIAFTLFTLKAAITGAGILGCDEELVNKWKYSLSIVPDYPLVPDSDPPVISDVQGGQPITYNVAVPALPVFPSGEVNWWSPEEVKQRFVNTLETISWTGYNSTMILAGARARLSMPGTHTWITDIFKERQMPSGFFKMLHYGSGGFGHDHRGNYSEQVAATGIVSEMLMQSVGGIVRLFPAWPGDRDAQFERLLAEGGFEISAVQQSGKVEHIRVKALFAGDFRILSPWPQARARVNGKSVQLQPEKEGILALSLETGDVAEFVSEGQ